MDKDILKGLFGDKEGVLAESAQKQILESIEAKVDSLVEERVEIALEAQDKSNVKMLQQVVEKYEAKMKKERTQTATKLDEEHATKAMEAFKVVEEDRTNKLIQVKKHYEALLETKVREEMTVISNTIDTFLENFIDSKIPSEIFEETAQRDHSTELLGKISRLITLDKTVSTDVKGQILESQATIKEQAEQLQKFELRDFVREATKNIPKLERQFIIENLKGHDVDYAKRNIDYLRTIFSKQQTKPVVTENTSYTNIDREQQVVEESTKSVFDEEALPTTAMAVWVENAMTNKPF